MGWAWRSTTGYGARRPRGQARDSLNFSRAGSGGEGIRRLNGGGLRVGQGSVGVHPCAKRHKSIATSHGMRLDLLFYLMLDAERMVLRTGRGHRRHASSLRGGDVLGCTRDRRQLTSIKQSSKKVFSSQRNKEERQSARREKD